MTTATVNRSVELPGILAANTYFWTPASSASQRRANEKRRYNEFVSFFESKGFKIRYEDKWTIADLDYMVSDFDKETGILSFEQHNLEVRFYYRESCHNVYKHLEVYLDSKKKDIRAVKKVLMEVQNVD